MDVSRYRIDLTRIKCAIGSSEEVESNKFKVVFCAFMQWKMNFSSSHINGTFPHMALPYTICIP